MYCFAFGTGHLLKQSAAAVAVSPLANKQLENLSIAKLWIPYWPPIVDMCVSADLSLLFSF